MRPKRGMKNNKYFYFIQEKNNFVCIFDLTFWQNKFTNEGVEKNIIFFYQFAHFLKYFFIPFFNRVITLWRDESLIPLGRKFNIPFVRLIFLRYTAHSWNYSMINRIFMNKKNKKKKNYYSKWKIWYSFYENII